MQPQELLNNAAVLRALGNRIGLLQLSGEGDSQLCHSLLQNRQKMLEAAEITEDETNQASKLINDVAPINNVLQGDDAVSAVLPPEAVADFLEQDFLSVFIIIWRWINLILSGKKDAELRKRTTLSKGQWVAIASSRPKSCPKGLYRKILGLVYIEDVVRIVRSIMFREDLAARSQYEVVCYFQKAYSLHFHERPGYHCESYTPGLDECFCLQ